MFSNKKTRKCFPTSNDEISSNKYGAIWMLRSHDNVITAASKFPQIPAMGGVKNVSSIFNIFLPPLLTVIWFAIDSVELEKCIQRRFLRLRSLCCRHNGKSGLDIVAIDGKRRRKKSLENSAQKKFFITFIMRIWFRNEVDTVIVNLRWKSMIKGEEFNLDKTWN